MGAVTMKAAMAQGAPAQAARLGDLEALERLIAYSEAELKEIAPGCAVLAGLLRRAIEQEILIEATRRAMDEPHRR